MEIIHIMKDGTTRDSLDGIVIPDGDFYQVLRGIIEKRGGKHQTRTETD